MGMALGNRNDQLIIANLDAAFTNSHLTNTLRPHQAATSEKLFDSNHTLKRVAHRLGATHHNGTTRGKWFGLLDGLPPATRDAIKKILQDALNNSNVDRVVFGVMAGKPADGYYIYPNNASPGETIPTSGSHFIYSLTLVCPGDFSGVAVSPNDPGNDHDSNGNDVEKPPAYLGP
jgi:hypothetical protein